MKKKNEHFKNVGQNWPQNWPKTGKKMVKIKQIYCHHFSGSKLHNKMVLVVFTRCFTNLGQKWAEMGKKWAKKNRPKNGQN